MKKWEILSEITKIKNPWVNIIAERVKDNNTDILDYWRVEKSDSIIVLPLWRNFIILPKEKYYRHGIGTMTYDFPGGRSPKEKKDNRKAVFDILEREIGIQKKQITSIMKINKKAFFINTSFSNQKLYGYIAEIDNNINLEEYFNFFKFSKKNKRDLDIFLEKLNCLQCRAIFMEYLFNHK